MNIPYVDNTNCLEQLKLLEDYGVTAYVDGSNQPVHDRYDLYFMNTVSSGSAYHCYYNPGR